MFGMLVYVFYAGDLVVINAESGAINILLVFFSGEWCHSGVLCKRR